MMFLNDNWCEFKWTPWVAFSDISKVIPASPGFYRVKPVDHQYLVYIGQTGDVRRRTNTLRRESNREIMPFRDPHTGAPCLWAWKDSKGLQFECSAAPSNVTNIERLAIEHYLFWQYRIEYGESPLCSFGRFHENYKISVRKRNIIGGRLTETHKNPTGRHSQAPLILNGCYRDQDWMGLAWSESKLFTNQEIQSLDNQPGVYKIFTENELLYIGETIKFKNRFSNHIRKDWSFPVVYFSYSIQLPNIASHQLKELENDLIAGYYEQTKTPPIFQFKNH